MEPIKRKSLATEVADVLRHRIKSGGIKVGEKLPTEPELMKRFEVGRSTIREAVKKLEQDGFVKAQQGIGTIVCSITGANPIESLIENSKLAEAHEVRQILEYKIVEKAALNRESEHIEAMRRCLLNRKHFGTKGMLKECIEADIEFHLSLAESCGNAILTELYKTLSVHVSRFFFSDYEDTALPMSSQKIHEDLLHHIENQDPVAAVETVKKLITEF